MASIFWRRLDAPGHDACRLEERDAAWVLEGTAVFRENAEPAALEYSVVCDLAWRTRYGQVRGWIGDRPVTLRIEHAEKGVWTVNGAPVRLPAACVDLDLGFTPATNLTQLRRLDLAPGQAADVDVAWWDLGAGTLEVLSQRYERRTAHTYWYESRRFDYRALLEVTPEGFVRRYPGLWEVDP
jgi:uncharacterized protein